MKHFSLLALLVLIFTISQAQDTIVKSNGDQIFCKIIDVYPTEIKYTKIDSLNGPIYVESKSNIQLIKYSNGSREEFTPQQSDKTLNPAQNNQNYSTKPIIPNGKIQADGKGYWYNGKWMKESEMHDILVASNDQQINLLVGSAKKSKRLKRWGIAVIPLALIGNMFITNLNDPETRAVAFDVTGASLCFSGAIAFSMTHIYFKRKQKTSNSEAIKLYNSKY
ncbi:MAG: hypothetical protein Q7W13_14940 [Bacteroidia bacterium]|nr:hypothetical protein [Bacteroidia bacterium]